MNWPSWDQAAVATVVLLLITYGARRLEGRPARATAAFARETALISFLYMVWRLARQLPLSQEEGAYERGHQIYDLQRWLHLPDELALERFAMRHHWLAELTVDYYATFHVPALLGFLVWLWVRHRDRYSVWRNALAITTGFCLFIRFIRVAPPRLLPELGFVDLSVALGRSVYGNTVTASGASDQFAAMPSIHIAWAAIVAFGLWNASTSRWRGIGLLHLALTFWAVVASANHWWMDGIVAIALIGVSLLLDRAATAVAARWRTRGDRGDQAGVATGTGHDPDRIPEPEPA